jgi:hypothetical protein
MNCRLPMLIFIDPVPNGIVPAAVWGGYHAPNVWSGHLDTYPVVSGEEWTSDWSTENDVLDP